MEKELDNLVRDLTKVTPMPKSEVRRRIKLLIDKSYNKGFKHGANHIIKSY